MVNDFLLEKPINLHTYIKDYQCNDTNGIFNTKETLFLDFRA